MRAEKASDHVADRLRVEPSPIRRGLSLYVHVPFCATRCGYCDFNTYTAAELGASPGTGQDAYLAAVVDEFGLAQAELVDPPKVQTVFFGGGTPTVLPSPALVGLLAAIKERFPLAADAEVTTEANPESVDQEYLGNLVQAGFTRLSLGMQSAEHGVLAVLERRHSPGRVAQVVEQARAVGFGSVSLDLIYGSPGETNGGWRDTLNAAIALAPDHLSAYSLTVESGTRLAARVARGELPGIDEDEQADRYLMAEEVLSARGYVNYEISNWALPGQECRHNLAYWRGDDWWGFGPGAHSHVGGVRWWNVRHPREYVDRLARRRSPAQEREVLTADQRHMERILLELRLADGLELEVLDEAELGRAEAFVADGLAEFEHGRLRLTSAGRLLADGVIRGLLGN